MFAKPCKLTFLLVVIATIAVGTPAPLEKVITTPIFKRDDFPICKNPNHIFKASLCDSISKLRVFCEDPNNPTLEIVSYMDCEPDKPCVEHIITDNNSKTMTYAVCLDTNANEFVRWDNFGNPDADACMDCSYQGRGIMEFAIIVYSTDNKPIEVDELKTFANGNYLTSANNAHNYTYIFNNYNEEKVRYCFNAHTSKAKIFGIASIWIDIYNKFI
jgi:hypothetical protein